ncbi:MAG: hypothetical protein LBS53_09000 [Synergistaceae bacterium]|jgi:hypothetical protein|nr:hypothetical protein [Synergistaceae bacterium]
MPKCIWKPFFFVVLTALLSCFAEARPACAVLPKKGAIAVIVTGPAQYLQTADAIISKGLIARGYKIVDNATLEKIKRDKAARLALDGNVEAILRLSSQYKYSVLLKATISDLRTVRDEFGFYKGTAILDVTAIASDASIIFADSISKSKPGHTQQDVIRASLELAANSAVEKMTD